MCSTALTITMCINERRTRNPVNCCWLTEHIRIIFTYLIVIFFYITIWVSKIPVAFRTGRTSTTPNYLNTKNCNLIPSRGCLFHFSVTRSCFVNRDQRSLIVKIPLRSKKGGKLSVSSLVHPKPFLSSPCTLLIYGKQCEPLPPRPAPAPLACLLEQVSNLWSSRDCSATGVSSMGVKHSVGYVWTVNPCQMLICILITVLYSNRVITCVI